MDNRLRAVRYIIFGEVVFLLFMGISVTLHPGFVLARREGGISEYGLHIKTAVLYTVAWAALALGNMRAAREYADGNAHSRTVRKLLLSYSLVSFLVLVSTYAYSLNAVLKYIHYGFGAILIVLMSWVSFWMYRHLPPSPLTRILLYTQVLGSVAALLSIVGVVDVLCAAETLSNVGCAILLARTCAKSVGKAPTLLSAATP